MMSQCHDKVALLPPMLFAPAGYYKVLAGYRRAVIDVSMVYDKRMKSAHRYDIVDTRGELSLTVPVTKPGRRADGGKARWEDVTVSTHGSWWDVHRVTLESAYGRTPFFEFYFDVFKPFFAASQYVSGEYPLMSLVTASDACICQILGIDTKLSVALSPGDTPDMVDDLRAMDFKAVETAPYYQHRGNGAFAAGLSVLDAIFNIGPEAAALMR
jgi:hypothetical protein